MARSKKKHHRQAAAVDSARGANAAPPSAPASLPADLPPGKLTRNRLGLAVSLAVIWIVLLINLAVFTANAVTLNRRQIQAASYVVRGKVVDARQGTVDVSREWKQNAKPDRITVANLSSTPARDGAEYLLPLTKRTDGQFEITADQEAREPGNAPAPATLYIYPATKEAEGQLEEILGKR